jgi:SRSO17 transposase
MEIQVISRRIEEGIEEIRERIKGCYRNRSGVKQSEKYLTGLLSPAERKNSWQLSEINGEKTPYAMQQFIYRGNWNADDVRDKLKEYVKEKMGDKEAVLVADETGFLKKGVKSAGVMRQYSGTAGRIENSQIGVFLTYAAAKGFTLIDRELYLPKEWTDDKERCAKARVPEKPEFRTKPQMALDMIRSAVESEMPFSWVTADSVYGDYTDIGVWLESISKGYVLAVSGKAYVWKGIRQHRISTLLNNLPEEGWERISAGTGTKGERYYDWVTIGVNAVPEKNFSKCVLVRRSISKPDELRAFICFYPNETSTKKLAEVAGIRWTVEQSFKESKGEVGLDHYEVRSYNGWYRHITLACFALALLTVLKDDVLKDELKKDTPFFISSQPKETSSMNLFKKGRNL